jgi:cobalt-precorrin 5A hydrolase
LKDIKINEMGSEVVEGFKCKPKKLDPNKPIMHYKTHIFVCDGERCKKAFGKDIATFLRELLKELKLNKGSKRIKISRGGCFGACRFRGVINIYENTRANGFLENDNLWIKKAHTFTRKEWEEIFLLLSSNKPLEKYLEKESFIQMKIFE